MGSSCNHVQSSKVHMSLVLSINWQISRDEYWVQVSSKTVSLFSCSSLVNQACNCLKEGTVCGCYLVTFLKWHLVSIGAWLVRNNEQIPERHMFKRDWTISSYLITISHSIVNAIGNTYEFSYGINRHCTSDSHNSIRVFLIFNEFFFLYCIFSNATHV